MAMSGAGSISIIWSPDVTNILYRIRRARPRMHAKASRVMQDFSEETEAWMKENAPWGDRTGAARGSLTAQIVSDSEDRIEMEAGYDIGYLMANQDQSRSYLRDYSIYLEGYLDLSILQPTYDDKFPDVMDRIGASNFETIWNG